MKSDAIKWETISETFQFLTHSWDVSLAKKLIQSKHPRKIETMDISGVADLVGKPPSDTDTTFYVSGVTVDWAKAASDEVDLTIPIILAPHRDSYMPIDGWHRIAKAVLTGVKELPCVVLNKTEAKAVKFA